MIDIKDSPDGKTIYIKCDAIKCYASRCSECGRITETLIKKTLPECPICKSKRIEKPKAVKCTYIDRIELGTLDNKKDHTDWNKRIDTTLKDFNIDKSGDYLCKEHKHG